MTDPRDWKALLCDWPHIQTYGSVGKLACLSDQQRQTILTFLQVAYWDTRWETAPDSDTLNAFVAKIEDKLMADCEITIRQTECEIELLVDGVVVSSFELDGEACPTLKGETGETGATGAKGDKGDKGDPGEDGGGFPAPPEIELTGTDDEKKTQVFSGCMNLILYLQEKITDFYAAAGAAASAAHAVSEWFHAFPIIETLSPVDNAIEAADEWLEATLASFEANDTPELREELACELFCIIVQNDYSFDQYAWALLLLLWNTKLLENAARIHYLTCGIFWPYNGLANRYILGLNDGNEDWMLLCDCAGGACGSLTFDAPEDLSYVLEYGTIEAIGNPLLGLKGELYTPPGWSNGRRAQVLLDLGEDKTLTAVSFDYNYHSFLPGGEIARNVTYYDSAMVQIDTWSSTVYRDHYIWHNTVATLAGVGVRYVRFNLQFVQNNPGSEFYIYGDNILIHCG